MDLMEDDHNRNEPAWSWSRALLVWFVSALIGWGLIALLIVATF